MSKRSLYNAEQTVFTRQPFFSDVKFKLLGSCYPAGFHVVSHINVGNLKNILLFQQIMNCENLEGHEPYFRVKQHT